MDGLIGFIASVFIFIGCLLLPFFVVSFFSFLYYKLIKRVKAPERLFIRKKKRNSFCKRLFFDFPRRFVLDLLTRDPNEFQLYGFHLFVGEQGSGKTVAVAEFLGRIKRDYPLASIATNFEYTHQDSSIESWKDLIFNNNGIYGQADVVDEVQNWFSSNQSKDFPPEMIQEITQQRKQRKIFIGTTQRFERMSKPLREQVNYLYYPMTLFGCLTIVRVFKPNVDADGQIAKKKPIRIYFFVHNDEIRNSFDTYHKIKKQAESGFNTDNRDPGSVTVTSIVDINKKSLPKRRR